MSKDRALLHSGGLLSGMLLAGGLSCGLLLGGCGILEKDTQEEEVPWSASQTALEIRTDGSVVETVVDRLDQSYYDGAELTQMVQEAVTDYNISQGAPALYTDRKEGESESGNGAKANAQEAEEPSVHLPVSVDLCDTSNGQVRLELRYAAPSDYRAFNDMPLFDGSVLEAQMEGYLFLQDFRSVDEEGRSVGQTMSSAEPLSHKELMVAVGDTSHMLHVPGRIVYVSANASVEDGRTAVPVEAETAPENIAAESEDGTAGPPRERSPEEMEDSYVYVLYEG